jgi:hypothetical protein
MSQDLEMRRPGGMALESGRERAYQAYNEHAFRHFLAVEKRRAQRAGRCLLLLLVELKADARGETQFAEGLVDRLFSVLNVCVREVDFIGWYRQGRVMGAVLTQGTSVPPAGVSAQIGERVAEAIGDRVPASVAGRLQVRVLQMRSSGKS